MSSEAQKRAQMKYAAANTVQKNLQFNKKTDADILEYLGEVGNVAGLIKKLLREQMAKDGFVPSDVKENLCERKENDAKDEMKAKLKAKGITLL